MKKQNPSSTGSLDRRDFMKLGALGVGAAMAGAGCAAAPGEQARVWHAAADALAGTLRILSDNGSCWSANGNGGLSALEVWLLQLGIAVSHGRPYHPQTQGKDERFHLTLDRELLHRIPLRSHHQIQIELDAPHAGADRALVQDPDRPDVAGVMHVRAAAHRSGRDRGGDIPRVNRNGGAGLSSSIILPDEPPGISLDLFREDHFRVSAIIDVVEKMPVELR